MHKPIMICALVLLTTGCSTSTPGRSNPGSRASNVVLVPAREAEARAPRGLNGVSPGHYPRPSEC